MIRFLVLALVFLLSMALSAPSEAQSRRELAARLDAAEARLAEVEARALQGDPVAEILMTRLDALEREQRTLTGEIERLAFENRQLRQELEQMGRDVDAILGQGVTGQPGGPANLAETGMASDDRFAEVRAGSVQSLQMPSEDDVFIEEAAEAVEQGLAQARQPALDVQTQGLTSLDSDQSLMGGRTLMDPDDLYAQGRTRLLEGDFSGARESFSDFVRDNSDHARASEAYYWLGETYFVSGQFDEAADSYIASLRANRQGPQGPDALVRLSASIAGLGETARACQVLASFNGEYPNASADDRRKAQRETARIGC